MKHLKRNIFLSVLGMVFCGGLLCGDAWASEKQIGDSFGDGDWVRVSSSRNAQSQYTLTCHHSTNASQYGLYYVKVNHYERGSYQDYYLNSSGMLVPEKITINGATYENYQEMRSCTSAINAFAENLENGHVDSTYDPDAGGTSGGNNGGSNAGYADNSVVNGGAEATILTGCAGQNDGADKIECLVNLVVDIFTVGVGVLGVTGVIIVGIQYLTAAGEEAKMTKAKRRMYEIVIGLVLYMVAYAILKWLLPKF